MIMSSKDIAIRRFLMARFGIDSQQATPDDRVIVLHLYRSHAFLSNMAIDHFAGHDSQAVRHG